METTSIQTLKTKSGIKSFLIKSKARTLIMKITTQKRRLKPLRRFSLGNSFLRYIVYVTITLALWYSLHRFHHLWLRKSFKEHPLILSNQLIDLYDFKYRLNPAICNLNEDILSVLVIISSTYRYSYRKSTRNTWGKYHKDFKIVFAIGEPKDEISRKMISKENKIYGDIIQGNFIDSFSNSTYKHIMGLKWAVLYCPVARFVVLAKDEAFVNLDKLKHVLGVRFAKHDDGDDIDDGTFIACKVEPPMSPWRKHFSRFYVPYEEYHNDNFPSSCGDLFIIYSLETAARIVEASQTTDYIHLDAVYTTGLIAKRILHVSSTNITDLMINPGRFRALMKDPTKKFDEFLFGRQIFYNRWQFYLRNDKANIDLNLEEDVEISDRYLNQLADLQDFTFLKQTAVCAGTDKNFIAIILVTSSPYSYYRRHVIRQIWKNYGDFYKIVFLFGQTNDTIFKDIMELEHREYGDIVQGNFMDTYKNLSYKHIMGLKWATEYCSKAKFIIKVDEDTFINIEEVKNLLEQLSAEKPYFKIACRTIDNSEVIRNEFNKWYVNKAERKKDGLYDKYCSGAFIVYSQDTARRLVEVSKTTKYFFIDDIYVTGLLANKLQILLKDISNLFMSHRLYFRAIARGFVEGNYAFGPVNIHPEDIERLWGLFEYSREKKKRMVNLTDSYYYAEVDIPNDTLYYIIEQGQPRDTGISVESYSRIGNRTLHRNDNNILSFTSIAKNMTSVTRIWRQTY